MRILNKLFPDRATLADAKYELSKREQEVAELTWKLSHAEQRSVELNSKITELTKKNKELLEKVREQTDADLALLSIRIVGEIAAGRKPKDQALDLQQSLIAQRQKLAAQSSIYNYPYGSLGAAFGLVG